MSLSMSAIRSSIDSKRSSPRFAVIATFPAFELG